MHNCSRSTRLETVISCVIWHNSTWHIETDEIGAIRMSDAKVTSSSAGTGGSKSRTGCSECKRKRVKCDEGKPTCGKCKRHPERCSYALKLSWTQGRPFKKPRTKEPWVIELGNGTPSSQDVPSKTKEAGQPLSVSLGQPQLLQVAENNVLSGTEPGYADRKHVNKSFLRNMLTIICSIRVFSR